MQRANRSDLEARRRELTKSGFEFCLTDLEMALTMLDRAETSREPETRERNRANARHALETVLHHMSQLELSEEQRERLQVKVDELKDRLSRSQGG